MRFLVMILRVFSYGYHILLGLFLLGIGLVGKLSAGHTSFSTPVLPGEGESQVWYAIGFGLTALITVFLAVWAKFRPAFILWTLAAVVLFFRGFFWAPYYYADADEFQTTLLVFAGAILAFVGSVPALEGDKRP